MPLTTGTRLGHYEIVSLLGEGGMGEVYKAQDTILGREVAIKLLLEEVSADPERLGRFEREARVLASLERRRHDRGQDRYRRELVRGAEAPGANDQLRVGSTITLSFQSHDTPLQVLLHRFSTPLIGWRQSRPGTDRHTQRC